MIDEKRLARRRFQVVEILVDLYLPRCSATRNEEKVLGNLRRNEASEKVLGDIRINHVGAVGIRLLILLLYVLYMCRVICRLFYILSASH